MSTDQLRRCWAQPSTAAAATAAVAAPDLQVATAASTARFPLSTFTTSSTFLIPRTVPRREIQDSTQAKTNAIPKVTAAVWKPGTGLNPAATETRRTPAN